MTTKTSPNLADYISFGDAAKELGVRYQQVYQRWEKGKLPGTIELFGKKLAHKADIAKWRASRKAYFEKK